MARSPTFAAESDLTYCSARASNAPGNCEYDEEAIILAIRPDSPSAFDRERTE